jgi:hypothetical protein
MAHRLHPYLFERLYSPDPADGAQLHPVPDAAARYLGEAWSQVTADLDRVDIEHLVDHCEYVRVCQLLARPFSVTRMDFQTIHRAIANTGDFHRPMFWISVKKTGEAPLPEESLVVTIRS